jgi:hypothetical protein
MAKQLFNVPALQKLTATAIPANNIYNLMQTDDHSGRSAMNLIPLVVDFNLSLGSITANLPALSEFFGGASAGVGFLFHGTITNNAPLNGVILVAHTGVDEVNTICGAPSLGIFNVGTAFKVWISGRLNWGCVVCQNVPIP